MLVRYLGQIGSYMVNSNGAQVVDRGELRAYVELLSTYPCPPPLLYAFLESVDAHATGGWRCSREMSGKGAGGLTVCTYGRLSIL